MGSRGLLTTLPALANLLLGIIAGEWIRTTNSKTYKVLALVVFGMTLMLIANFLNPLIPINKKIWTPSFMLLSGGFSLIVMGLLWLAVDEVRFVSDKGKKILLAPALIFGSNAILGFSLATIISPILGVIRFHSPNKAQAAIPELGFLWFSHFLNPWNASLAYAIFFVFFIMALLWPLYRRRLFVRL